MSTVPPLREALRNVPSPLVEALEDEFTELSARFARQDWGPAELHGGRLAEALLRYLEWKSAGTYTAIGARLDRLTVVGEVERDASLDEGLRFHVRRCAELLMDVRNKRDVAHLGEAVDINEMDSRLVMRLGSWALAEIVRVEAQVSPEDAQKLINRLAATHLPLVEKIDGDLVLLEKRGTARERSLIVLLHEYPEPVEIEALRRVVGYTNPTNFRTKVLAGGEQQGLLHLKNGSAYLTRKGAAWVEQNVDFKLNPSA